MRGFRTLSAAAGLALLAWSAACTTSSRRPDPTPEPTATPSHTPTDTPTASITRTSTFTITNTSTISWTASNTYTRTNSGTTTHTRTVTNSFTPTCPPTTCSATPTPSGPNYFALIGAYCTNLIHVAPITGGGTLGSWTTQPNFPVSFGQSGTAAVGNCLFSVAGYNCASSFSTSYVSTASGATLSSWTTTTALSSALFTNRLVEDSGFVFSLSGGASGSGSAVYRAAVSGCTIGAWTSQTALPAARIFSAVVKAGTYVYYIGGGPGSFTPTSTVYYATLSGGFLSAWASTTALPSPGVFGHEAVTDGSYVYVIGGAIASGYVSTIYAAQITGGGTLSSWTTTTALPAVRSFLGASIANGYLYITGGGGSSGATNTVWSAPIGGGVVGSFTTLGTMPTAREDHRMVAY